MLKRLFILLFLIVESISIFPVEINYPTVIQKYSMLDGLSNDIVYDVCRDADGCIWFATAEGISKFNGLEFSSYDWKRDSAEMINHQALKILYNQNKMYVATHFGIVVYNMELNNFKTILPSGTNSMKVKALAYSSDGNIWVGSYDGHGVYKYNITDGSFTPLQYQYTDNRVISLYEDKEGHLYIGTHFGGLDVVDLKTNHTINYSDIKVGMPDKQVEKILEDSFGNIWIGTWGGLVHYNKTNQKLRVFSNGKLKDCKINALEEDQTGNLWVGTETGLISFNIREALLNPHNFKMDSYDETRNEYGLSYRTVLDLHCDSNNNIWIATNSGGVNFIARFQPQFSRIIYDPRLENSLSYRRVTSVSEDETGNLWIATDGGGVNYYDKEKKNISVFNKNNSNLKDNAVLCSLVDSDGDVWFGTYNNMLYHKNTGNKNFSVYKGSESTSNTLMSGDLLCLAEDDYKRIWVGQRSGLVYFDKKQQTFVQIPELKWICVNCIYPTKDGIYIGAQPKVFFYDFITKELKSPHPIFENLFTNCLFVDEDNKLWIGTKGQGLFCYNPQDKSIVNFNIQSGLPSDDVCKILQDNGHNFWISTTKGITKISKSTKEIQNFNTKDGIQPGMFIENCGTRTRSGQILLGGTEGLTLFYPSEVKRDFMHPNIIFTNFLLFNNPVQVRSASNPKSPLEKDVNYVDEIMLEYDESVFTIEYASVDYRSTGQINYAYILEGADKDWNYVKDKRIATYRYLAPGTYLFKVMASNFDGQFDSSKYRNIKITINPPFYMTWWAYIIYVILFFVLCYLVWVFLTIKTKALNQIKYERLERRKSEELHQEKLLFFTNISHELKTPLTLIAAPVDRLLKDETSNDKKYLLSLIKRNVVRLLNNINQIMDIRKIDRDLMKLRVKEMDIVSFVGEVIELFKDLAQSKHIELEYSHQYNELLAWIDPEFLDKILCNILSNAMKFTPEHGEIIVNLFTTDADMPEDSRLCIEITDTGKGIPEQHLSRIFERFYQAETVKVEKTGTIGSGVGLHLVKSLLELHKGTISVESKVGVGTKFIVSIPFTGDNYTVQEKVNGEYTYYHAEQLSAIGVTTEFPQQEEDHAIEQRNKILIIDDDPEILNFLKFELGNDYDIIQASNGRIGLEKACETIPDLIISDVMMTEMDGIKMCKELKTNINTSHIPVILLTAKSTVDDRIEGLEVGADSYIPKPFDIRHLRVRIKKLIELRENIRSRYVENLGEQTIEKPKGTSSLDEKLLQKIVEFIRTNISDPDINGETIAQHVAMSRMSLHRKLKALTGLSAGEFIRNIRLEEAKKMLEDGGRTVSEVSYDVGYTSPSYFYTCFVKKFGVSPSDINRK